MKREMLMEEAVCYFGHKPQTPEMKRAEQTVRRAAAVLSFCEWAVDDAAQVLECQPQTLETLLSIFGSPGFDDISVLWFPDGKFLIYLRETPDRGGDLPF